MRNVVLVRRGPLVVEHRRKFPDVQHLHHLLLVCQILRGFIREQKVPAGRRRNRQRRPRNGRDGVQHVILEATFAATALTDLVVSILRGDQFALLPDAGFDLLVVVVDGRGLLLIYQWAEFR